MRQRLFVGPEAMTKAVRALGAEGPTAAAVAYATYDHLDLGGGDILVANASIQAVEAGATSPRLLLDLMRRGVRVGNAPDLHAKTIVRRSRAAIGSANLSQRTLGLTEAVLVTDDEAVVTAAARFVKELAARSPVTQAELEDLAKRFPRLRNLRGPERAGPSRTRNPFAPDAVGTVWLFESSDSPEDALDDANAAAVAAGLHDLDDADWVLIEGGTSAKFGDVFIGFRRGWIRPPMRYLAEGIRSTAEPGSVWALVGRSSRHRAVRMSEAPEELLTRASARPLGIRLSREEASLMLALWSNR